MEQAVLQRFGCPGSRRAWRNADAGVSIFPWPVAQQSFAALSADIRRAGRSSFLSTL